MDTEQEFYIYKTYQLIDVARSEHFLIVTQQRTTSVTKHSTMNCPETQIIEEFVSFITVHLRVMRVLNYSLLRNYLEVPRSGKVHAERLHVVQREPGEGGKTRRRGAAGKIKSVGVVVVVDAFNCCRCKGQKNPSRYFWGWA